MVVSTMKTSIFETKPNHEPFLGIKTQVTKHDMARTNNLYAMPPLIKHQYHTKQYVVLWVCCPFWHLCSASSACWRWKLWAPPTMGMAGPRENHKAPPHRAAGRSTCFSPFKRTLLQLGMRILLPPTQPLQVYRAVLPALSWITPLGWWTSPQGKKLQTCLLDTSTYHWLMAYN